MAFAVQMYTFTKNINSTKLPTGAGVVYNCEFKDTTSIINMQLRVTPPTGGLDVYVYNYAYIAQFARYYYVTDWTWDINYGMFIVSLSIDCMATYKAAIGAINMYVLRASNDYDGAVTDNMYPIVAETALSSNTDGSPWDIESGDYVVGVMGGAGSYYAFSKSGLSNFFNNLYSDDYLESVVGLDVDLNTYPELRPLLNPMQYISGITYIPRQVNGSNINAITVGWGGVVGISGTFIDDYLQTFSGSFSVPNHPQSGRGSYLNLAPYTEHSLFFPPYGYIDLDSSVLSTVSSISYDIDIDVRTGDSTLTLSVPRHTLTRIPAKVGVNVQQTQSVSGGYSVLQGAIRMAQGAVSSATSLNPFGTANDVITEIGSAYAGQIPSVKTIGSNGGVADLDGAPVLQTIFRYIAGEDNANKGRPLCAVRNVAQLGGYILPSNPDIEINGTLSEHNMLQNILRTGFYYE